MDHRTDSVMYLNRSGYGETIRPILDYDIPCRGITLLPTSQTRLSMVLRLPAALVLSAFSSFLKYPDWNDRLFWSVLRKKKDILILNSIEPTPLMRKADYFARKGMTVFVILHNGELIRDPEYRRFLSRVNVKVFVLSEMVLDYLNNRGFSDAGLMSPVYFNLDSYRPPAEKASFLVQGNVSFNRRNYSSLVRAVEGMAGDRALPGFTVKILGNSQNAEGNLLRREVNGRGLSEYFVFYDSPLDFTAFYREVSESNFLLALQDRTSIVYSPYFESKCSAVINLSLGFQRPLVIHREQASANRLDGMCITYPDGGLGKAMKLALKSGESERNTMESRLFKKKEALLKRSFRDARKALEDGSRE